MTGILTLVPTVATAMTKLHNISVVVKALEDRAVDLDLLRTAVGDVLGGTAKGVLDTVGNNFGNLGEGLLTDTVDGLRKGVGNAAEYGGSAMYGTGRIIGRLGFRRLVGKQTQAAEDSVNEINNQEEGSTEMSEEERRRSSTLRF
ncbi:hypothetical protein CC78DRAFT_577409 [Lojkania enalia]|uniref:Uncharacterized protein n=1 Tax=Lojkania enalia TaxID=147567 RepID=A0A9P4N2F5_9PLEO|nr:hypothetical protein CC78DRAFT_577409 [Didymosphaeria enalia]